MQAVRFLRAAPRVQEMFAFIALNTVCVWGVELNLLPSVADTVLRGNAETFGRLLASSGAGALFGAVFIAPLVHSRRRSGLLVGGAAVWAGGWLTVFALSTWEPLSLLSMALAMVSSPIMFTTALSLVQMMAPDNMRARVVSLLNMMSFGTQPAAALIIGNLGERIGVQPTMLLCGVGMLIGAGSLVILRPQLRTWEAPGRADSSPAVTYPEHDSLPTPAPVEPHAP
jgi:predicted MFS family arabinose efflux permease